MPRANKQSDILNAALACGFDAAALAPAGPTPGFDCYQRWLSADQHSTMAYLEKNLDIRADPRTRYPWAKSVLVVALRFDQPEPDGLPADHPLRGLSQYAWGRDYHRVMDKKLKALSQRLTKEGLIQPDEARWFCDAGPINERAWAMAAGLGAQGRNGLLLHPELGSALYLGIGLLGVETDARIEPIADLCGRCRLCVDACPTGAINPDRTIDSAKCIAYWTIEAKDDVTPELSDRFGQWWFGCDLCRRCCPRQPPPAPVDSDLTVRPEYLSLTFDRLLTMSESEFNEVFQASAVRRAGLEKIKRTIRSMKRDLRSAK